ncbi:MAG TPA: MOSC domain-containing protein [Anaerolineae bacterium]|nr:MOSC domain-containing protein [Anaerolineae bacterium]
MTATLVGSVVALWRYTVKSMPGEAVAWASIHHRGLLGDRAYALLDRTTGHIASAKYPRKWGKLFECRAAFSEPPQLGQPLPPVLITLPDGTVISSAEPEVDRLLSEVVGREVALVREAPPAATREADRTPILEPAAEKIIRTEALAVAAPAGTFFDYAPLHLLTTATLNRFQKLYPAGRFEVQRFRPNLLISPPAGEQGFIENGWLGYHLAVGREVQLEAIDPCPRCVVTTLPQGDLPHDPDILRTVTRHNAVASVTVAPGVVFPAVAGIYAGVVQGGLVHCGDSVWLR